MDVEALAYSTIQYIGDSLAKLPDVVRDLEFMYSEDENDCFFEPGLRVKADVELKEPCSHSPMR